MATYIGNYYKYDESHNDQLGLLAAIEAGDFEKVYQVIKEDTHFENLNYFASLIFRNPKSSISADKRNKARSILFLHLLEICDAIFQCLSNKSLDHHLIIRPKYTVSTGITQIPVETTKLNIDAFYSKKMSDVYFYIEDNWEVLNYTFPNLFELPNSKDIFNKRKYEGREIEYGFLYLVFIQEKLKPWIKTTFNMVTMMDNFLCKNPHYKPFDERIILALDFKSLNDVITHDQVKKIFLEAMAGLRSYLTLPILIKYNMREDVVKVLIKSRFTENHLHINKESLNLALNYLNNPKLNEFISSEYKFSRQFFHEEKRKPLFYKDLIIHSPEKALSLDLLGDLGVKNKLVKRTVYPNLFVEKDPRTSHKAVNACELTTLPIIDDIDQQQVLAEIYTNSKKISEFENTQIYEGIHCLNELKFFEDKEHFLRFVRNGFKDPVMFRDLIEPLNLVFRERIPNEAGEVNFSEYIIGSDFEDLFLKKFKGSSAIKQMHDWVSKNCVYSKKAEFHQKEIIALDELSIHSYKIRVAKSNQDLVEAGSTLNICVGNGTYYRKVLMNQSYIFFLSKYTDKVSTWDYCVELDSKFNILQAKGRNNDHLERAFRNDLEDIIRRVIKKELTFSEKMSIKIKEFFSRRKNV